MIELQNVNYEDYSEFIYRMHEKCSSYKNFPHDERYGTPFLSFLIVGNGSSKDMYCIVTSDNGSIIQMCKDVKLNKNKRVRKVYCIANKYVNFIHFNSGKIVNSLEEFAKVERSFMINNCDFYLGDEKVDYETMLDDDQVDIEYKGKILKGLRHFIRICPKIQSMLAYYIPPENYNFIHIFANVSKTGIVDDDDGYDAVKLINKGKFSEAVSIFDDSLRKIAEREKFKQHLNNEVGNLIICRLF